MDFDKMNDDELINYCISNNISYLQKNKKVYKRKTLLLNIKKSKMELPIIKDKEEIKEEEVIELNEVIWTLEKNQDINIKYKQIKDKLYNIVKRCHQLLYSTHSIVGIKAQNDIMKLLTLKILQPQFSNENTQLYKSCLTLLFNDEISKEDYDDYMSYCLDLNNFNEIYNKKESPLQVWKLFVNGFLSKILESLYDFNDSKFNFEDDKTFMDLIKIINEIKIDDDFIDAFSTSYGDIHEAFRVYSGGKGAKELGQFFTPRNLIHSIFHGCGLNDIIKSFDNPTIYDPCMGTCGLLTRAYSNGNILSNNIYGCETEKDTIKFGECSLLLTTKCFNSNIERCDSLCKNPFIFTNKFDIIFTNPPFGTKMNYSELEIKFNEFDEKYKMDFKTIYPIKTNNGACLFIQHCIYMLKENGICAIVLPDGELFTGKTFMKFREFLCKTVNILKIINIDSGVFEHTPIKTSVIIFKKNGSTKNIEYLKINKDCNEVIKSAIVNINNIKKGNYDFNLSKYIKKEKKEDIKYEIKKLGDIFNILPKSKKPASYGKKEGLYPFFKSSNKIDSYIDIPDYNEESIIIGDGGEPNINYAINFSTSDHCYILQSIDKNKYNNKYIYYYLNNNLDILKPLYTGIGIKNISKENIKNIEIPIPSLENQEKIINNIENLIENIKFINLRNKNIKNEEKIFIEYCKKKELEILLKEAEIKKLGDIFNILPKSKKPASYGKKEGLYPFFKSSNKIDSYIDIPDYNEESIIIGDGGEPNINYAINFSTSDHCYILQSIDKNKYNNKYIYYYLNNNLDILKPLYTGIGIKNISKENIKNIEIPIPSLENQEKIIDIEKEFNKYEKIKEDNNKQIEFINELINKIFSS